MRISYVKWMRLGLLGLAAGVFLFSSYKVYAYVSDNYESKKTYTTIKDLYYTPQADNVIHTNTNISGLSGPTQTSAPGAFEFAISPKFKPLLEKNDEIVGWLRIDDTPVDYPVTQTDNNEYYLTHDVNKKENITGSIFMDYRNNIKGYNRNTILYSHSMKNGTMFGAVLRYESRWNFENKPIIEFDTIYGDEKWEIFSAYKTDTSFDYIRTDFASDEEFQQYLDTVKAMSLHKSDVEVTASDQILTLSTCYHGIKNGRFVVHAKLIRDTKTGASPLSIDPVTGLPLPPGSGVINDEVLSLEPKIDPTKPVTTEETKKPEKKPVKKPAKKPAEQPVKPDATVVPSKKPSEAPSGTQSETPPVEAAVTGKDAVSSGEASADQSSEASIQPKQDEVVSEQLTKVTSDPPATPSAGTSDTPAAEPGPSPDTTETAASEGH
jgi:sortase B